MAQGFTNDDVVIKRDGNLVKGIIYHDGKPFLGQGFESNEYNAFFTRRMKAQLVYDANCKLIPGPHKAESVNFERADMSKGR